MEKLKSNKPVVVNAINRPWQLEKRDAAYAASKSHPRLTEDGRLKVDPMPLATDLIGLRPMTKEEQIARYTGHGVVDWSLVPDTNFLSEEDFHDYLDDLPEEGLSPYEVAGMKNIYHAIKTGRDFIDPQEGEEVDEDPAATPLPEPVAKRPQKAGVAKGDPSGEPDGE